MSEEILMNEEETIYADDPEVEFDEAELGSFDESFGDGVKSADDFDLADDEEAADQPQTEAAVEPAPAQEVKEEAPADQRFSLKHLDETREVSREEVIALAQKGLDYDRIRERYEKEKGSNDAYLTYLRREADKNGINLETYMMQVMTRSELEDAKKRGETLSPDEALARVRTAIKEKKAADDAAAQADNDAAAAQKRMDSFRRFTERFPDVKPENIAKEIWDEFGEGRGDLADIYARHENKMLRDELKKIKAENEALRQNNKNTERSTGSRQTSGREKAADPFDDGFGF